MNGSQRRIMRAKRAGPENICEHQEKLAELARGLSHPLRVEIVRMLANRRPDRPCICGDIVNALPLAQSTVSQHLKVLKDAGLIRGEIDGPRTCYCIEPRTLARAKALVAGL